jgi:predicted DNA-binding protein (MmcQ/YjbR family)
MELPELKRYLRARPATTEDSPWGPQHLAYKVMGKLFAVLAWDESPMRMSLKCDPDRVDELRAVFPAVRPAPYFDKRHWNAVILDGSIPDAELEAMIDESFALVLKKLTRAQRASVESLKQLESED